MCVSSKHQHGSTHYHSCVQVTEKSAVLKNGPHLGVHVISVEIVCKPVFIGAESLVASMNIDCPSPVIIDTAMAIASLDEGTMGM